MPLPVSNAIALDIGEVCVRLHPDRCARLLGFASMEEIFTTHPRLSRYSRDVETGRQTVDEFLALMSRKFLTHLTPADIKHAWLNFLGDEIQGMARLVAEMVAAGYKPVFLSDISTLHHTAIQEKLSFSHLITDAVVSYDVGALKPAAAMYEAFETRCGGCRPALYLDDKIENINAARERSWNARHVSCVDDARRAVEALILS
ncbi:MAG: hypothetical protein RRC34_05270 [Lentisphaeria bacterium]|nr:hypothetical protein [Lentisphaeria bacterium]